MDAKNTEMWADGNWMKWQANAFSLAIPMLMTRKVAESMKTTKAVLGSYAIVSKISNVLMCLLKRCPID